MKVYAYIDIWKSVFGELLYGSPWQGSFETYKFFWMWEIGGFGDSKE